jgi:hypothetical protein
MGRNGTILPLPFTNFKEQNPFNSYTLSVFAFLKKRWFITAVLYSIYKAEHLLLAIWYGIFLENVTVTQLVNKSLHLFTQEFHCRVAKGTRSSRNNFRCLLSSGCLFYLVRPAASTHSNIKIINSINSAVQLQTAATLRVTRVTWNARTLPNSKLTYKIANSMELYPLWDTTGTVS